VYILRSGGGRTSTREDQSGGECAPDDKQAETNPIHCCDSPELK
jgi:hypothetical protein